MSNIIFVCTGNICRSPMAEGLLRHRWQQAGGGYLRVSSMGTHGVEGLPAETFAQAVCADHEIDISAHQSRLLVGDEIKEADLILCMEEVHRKFVQTFFPWQREHIFLLGAWPGKANRKSGISDPMGGTYEDFLQTFNLIDYHIMRILSLL